MKEKKSVIENGMLKKYFGDKTNIVIPEGSYAQQYAKEKNIKSEAI